MAASIQPAGRAVASPGRKSGRAICDQRTSNPAAADSSCCGRSDAHFQRWKSQFCGWRSAAPERGKEIRFADGAVVSSHCRLAVCDPLRGHGRTAGSRALEPAMDRQSATMGLSGTEGFAGQWVCSGSMQRPGNPGYLDRLPRSRALSRRATCGWLTALSATAESIGGRTLFRSNFLCGRCTESLDNSLDAIER